MVTIRIPAPSSMLVANLLGVLGLVAVVVAVGGLAGVWWAVLTGGVFAVGLAAIAQKNLVAESSAHTGAAAAPSVPLAAVEEPSAA